MDLKKILQTKLKSIPLETNPPVKNPSTNEEDEYFNKLMHDMKIVTADDRGIPRFHRKLPKDDEPLRQKLREESRSSFLRRKTQDVIDNNELKQLWLLLDRVNNTNGCASSSSSSSTDDQLITYETYMRIVDEASAKIKPYLTSVVFAKLLQHGDSHDRVSIMSIFNYIMRKVWMKQTRIGLSLYDSTGQGYLSELDLENYITELIPNMPQLEGLEKSFYSFYVCTAVRKFLFFLDTARAGRVRILDILASSFLDDLLELRDEDLSKESQEENWFSAPSALKIYGHYLNLDRDHNGMLNKGELAGYGSGTLTQPFLDRVFQTCLTYSGEIDYKTYLDLVLALQNRGEPQALAFFFRILDIREVGYLNAFAINYFFRAIQEEMKAHGAEAVAFDDVKDELFDMVRPKHPERIYLDDLITCGQGDTFVSILIEFRGFWAYENRETVASDPIQDSILM